MKLILGIILALVVPIAGTIMTDAPVIWPVSTLIYNLGLVYSLALAPKKAARIIAYIIVAATFFVFESSFFFSYYLQNAGFNEAFFYHIRPDLLYAGVREYLPLLMGMIACLFGLLVLSSLALAYYLFRNNTRVYAHTVNDIDLFSSLRKIGVFGIYTDFIVPP